MLRIREDTSVVRKRFGFAENSVHQFAEMVEDTSWVRHGTGSQAVTTAATAHGRGGRRARCCAMEPKAKRNHRARATQSRNASNTQHHLTHQQATPHSKWHELAQEYRSSSVSRDASISPHRERDQGSFTTIRRRRQRLCEGITGRAIVVMTIASRWREASIVFRDPTARRVERGSSNEVARYADLDAEHSMSAKEPF